MSSSASTVAWPSAPVAAIDLEMTGLDVDGDRIVEVAVVQAVGPDVVSTWSTLVRADRPMGKAAARVTGLNDAALVDAPCWDEVADAVADRLAGHVVLGHRVGADLAFLAAAETRRGRTPWSLDAVDTHAWAARWLALRSHRLADVCAAFGLDVTPSHRALADAVATHACWVALARWRDPRGEASIEALRALWASEDPAGPLRAEVWRRALDAARRGDRVELVYVGRDADDRVVRTRREVTLRASQGDQVVGFCHLRGEERAFRRARIEAVTPLGTERHAADASPIG
ncbi:MAG: hypothetical protein RLZZ383_1002 [Pseudomonadota bacterium]